MSLGLGVWDWRDWTGNWDIYEWGLHTREDDNLSLLTARGCRRYSHFGIDLGVYVIRWVYGESVIQSTS